MQETNEAVATDGVDQMLVPEQKAPEREFDPFKYQEQKLICPAADAMGGNEAKAVRSRQIAKDLGVSRTAVDLNYDNMQTLAEKADRQRALSRAPSVARWAVKNPYDAAVLKTDIGFFEGIENEIGEIGSSISRGFQVGDMVAEQGADWARLGNAKPSEGFLKADKARDQRMQDLTAGDDGFFFSASQVVGTMYRGMIEGLEGGAATAALGGAAMAAGAIPVAGQTLLGATAIGSAAYGTYVIEGGLNLKEQYDEGVDYDKARTIATGVGFANALTEMVGLHLLGKAAAPALRPLVKRFSPKTVESLENITTLGALRDAAKMLSVGTGQEVVTEVIQEVNAIAGEELGKAWSGIDSDLTAEAFVDRLREVAVQTAKAMVVLGGISAGPAIVANMNRVRVAKQNAEALGRILDNYNASQAAKTSPEVAEEVLDSQAKEAGADTVWIDAQSLRQTMIEQNVSVEELQTAFPEMARQVNEQAAVGGDVSVPLAKFASKLGSTNLGLALRQHVRFNQDGLSEYEAAQVETAYKQLRADAIKAALDPNAQEAALPTEQQARRKADRDAINAFKAQMSNGLQAAGMRHNEARTQASLVANMVAKLVNDTGIPAARFIESYAPSIAIKSSGGTSVADGGVGKFYQGENRSIQEQSEFQATLKRWLSKDAVTAAKGKSLNEIILQFGNQLEPIAFVPERFLKSIFSSDITDNRVYSGKGYFLDHVVNHHPQDIALSDYMRLQEMLSEPDEVIIDRRGGKEAAIFVRKYDASYMAVVKVEKTPDGRLQLYKSLNKTTKEKPYPKLARAELPVHAHPETIGDSSQSVHAEKDQRTPGGDNFSGPDNSQENIVPRTEGDVKNGADEVTGEAFPGAIAGRKKGEEATANFGETQEQEISTLKQSARAGVVRGSFSPADNRITLTPNADLSTFSHEMGHWYMATLIDLVRTGQANDSIREDVAALFKQFGVADVASWDALGFEGQRKYHEQFASWVEQYLAEAKAPKGLKRFFINLGKFIRDVYRNFTGGVVEATQERYRAEIGEELPALSAEVRQVLDRMVMSEKAVNEYQAAESLHPLFDTKPADMSEADWLEMQRAREEADEEGMAEIVQRRAKDDKWYDTQRGKLLREKNKEAKEYRAKVREGVERSLNGRKEFIALDILSSRGKDFALDNFKFSAQSVRELGFTEQTVAKLRTMGVIEDSGMTVEQARAALEPMARFSSAKGLIRGLLSTENREQRIEEETTRLCLARRSDLFDPREIDRTITSALHNEARARMVAAELKYLTKDLTSNSRVLAEAARRAARDILDRTPAKGFTPRAMMALESRASRKAYQAIRNGDKAAAGAYKRQQLVYHEAARLAVETEKSAKKFKELKASVFKSDKALSKTYDVNVIAVARAILANRGYGKVRAGEMVPAETYLDKVKKYDPDLLVGLQAYLARHPYTGADVQAGSETAGQMLSMLEDLQALVKLARDRRTVELDGKTMDIDDAVSALVAKAWGKEYKPSTGHAVTKKEKRVKRWLTAKAYLRRVEDWCRTMDGGEAGPFTRYIFRPVVNAATRYRNRNVEIQKRLVDILELRRRAWDSLTDIEAPEIGYTFSRKQELIAAILHTGNASNKEKLLLGGRGPDAPWADMIELPDGEQRMDTSRWDMFMARCFDEGIITKKDMDAVQAIWDLLEQIKPDSQRAFREYYGFYFEEIPASPVMTPWGQYRGGYVPAAADIDRVAQSDKQAEQDLFDNSSEFLDQMPVTRPGFTQSRTKVHRPLSLDLSFLSSHVQKATKFAMMAPTIKQVQRILHTKELKNRLNEIDPQLLGEMLEPWLRRSATQSVSTPANWFDKKLDALRGLAGMAIMSGNIINALQQFTGLSVAISQVGAKPMVRALAAYTAHPKGYISTVKAMSPYMKARLENFEFEFQERIQKIAQVEKPTTLEAMRGWTMRHAYFLQMWIQMVVDTPTWMAGYEKALAAGKTDAEAVQEADAVVRRTQSAFEAESLARVETGSPLARTLLVFYNYFNMQANLLGTSWALNREAGHYGKFMIDFALILAIPSILSQVLIESFMGFDTGDDDDWDAYDAARLLISPVVKNVVALVPFAGQIVNAAATELSKAMGDKENLFQVVFAPNSYNSRLVSIPAESLIQNSLKAVGQLSKAATGEEVNARSTMRNTLDALTLVTGIPFAAAKRPLSYAAGVAAGQIEPDSAANAVRGAIAGKEVKSE
jgi:hypothetical protein